MSPSNFEWSPGPTVFSKVRVAERSVEGRHSVLHRVLRRAPRASISYLSLEMRFQHLQQLAATRPECLQGLLSAWVQLETTAGLRQAVVCFVLTFQCLCVQLLSL